MHTYYFKKIIHRFVFAALEALRNHQEGQMNLSMSADIQQNVEGNKFLKAFWLKKF